MRAELLLIVGLPYGLAVSQHLVSALVGSHLVCAEIFAEFPMIVGGGHVMATCRCISGSRGEAWRKAVRDSLRRDRKRPGHPRP
jgi:hypothetical protein